MNGAGKRNKGARGELEWRDQWRVHGYTGAYRSAQYCGRNGDQDVICPEIEILNLHQEVKRTECLRLHEAMKQAKEDGHGKIPIVAHKRNREEWMVTMRAEDWFKMIADSLKTRLSYQP